MYTAKSNVVADNGYVTFAHWTFSSQIIQRYLQGTRCHFLLSILPTSEVMFSLYIILNEHTKNGRIKKLISENYIAI